MPCAADERSARFGTMRAFHIVDMKKSVNVSFYIFFELMTASKGDESTKYSQSPCDDDERSARFGTMRAFHIVDMKKSVNVSFYIFFELMTASKGDESTKYSQSPCDDDERSARLKTALLYLCYTKI